MQVGRAESVGGHELLPVFPEIGIVGVPVEQVGSRSGGAAAEVIAVDRAVGPDTVAVAIYGPVLLPGRGHIQTADLRLEVNTVGVAEPAIIAIERQVAATRLVAAVAIG